MWVIEAGGMKLHEFHVYHPATGSPRNSDAIASGNVRITGIQINPAGAASGQHHEARGDHFDALAGTI